MASRDANQATETLHEIESAFDRLAHWAGANPGAVLSVLGGVLLVAAGGGALQAWRNQQSLGASAEVAQVQNAYLDAMGAQSGAFEFVEPANAEAAKATREEFAAKFLEVADRQTGTAGGVAARLEAATLLNALGKPDQALEAWRKAAREAPSGTLVEALARIRLARALEASGDPAAAAAEFEQAGQVADYPGRVVALADAARSYADAGNVAKALALFAALESEKGELPHYISARLRELRVQEGKRPPVP